MLTQSQTSTLIQSIIERQSSIMGPLAYEQAKKVNGLSIGDDGAVVLKSKNYSETLSLLVSAYEQLFGRASVEACKDAIRETQLAISSDNLPAILK